MIDPIVEDKMSDNMSEVNIDSAEVEGIEEAWLNLKALAAKRKELLRRANRYLSHQDDCALRYNDQVCDCRLSKLRLEIAEELGDD